jgi:putative hemolysin
LTEKILKTQLSEKAVSIIRETLEQKNIQVEIDARDIKNLPQNSPFICVANQAAEDVDDLIVLQALGRQPVPFKLISARKKTPEELGGFYKYFKINLLQWEDDIKHLFKVIIGEKEKGNAVCLFFQFTDKSFDTIVRNRFLNQLMKIVLRAEMPIVPVRLKVPFPDFFRPGLSGKLIQLKRKEPYIVSVRIGSPITLEEQQKIGKPKEFRRFLQSRIFSLGTGLEVKPAFWTQIFNRPEQKQTIIDPVDPAIVEAEISALRFKNLIASQGEFDIFVVEAEQIPQSLREIGRLRELTFREVGEGTGKRLDLDEFDLYYRQLILWDREEGKIIGGYRMGVGEEIFQKHGAEGFYISSMFKIKEGFHPIMRKAIELGRSYVIPEYQKKRLPLFLLWKGILYFLLQNPQYRYLYGPVSISKHYSNISRSVIVEFIKRHYYDNDLAQYLKPRKPFKVKIDKVDVEMLAENLPPEMAALDNLVEEIEPAHFRIPVLVRQYLKLNARFISFNIDPNFSDVLDGFIILDLDDVPIEMIEALRKESN